MQPPSYAILLHVAGVAEASADEVVDALRSRYGRSRALKPAAVAEVLMTAAANGLLEESRFALDDDGELRIWYRATETGAARIQRLLGRPDRRVPWRLRRRSGRQ